MDERLLGLVDLRADPLKEERHRCVQGGRCSYQCDYGDAVCASFVFLDLLKADPQECPQLPLAQPKRLASGAETISDDDIDRITAVFVFAPEGPGLAGVDR